jgi:hypothetical protein
MEFTIAFVSQLARLIFYFLPLFITLSLAIICLALWVGRQEKWGEVSQSFVRFFWLDKIGRSPCSAEGGLVKSAHSI